DRRRISGCSSRSRREDRTGNRKPPSLSGDSREAPCAANKHQMIAPLRFLVDEDFDHTVIRGVTRRAPELAILTVQEAGLSGEHDIVILEFAANESASC